MSTKQRPTLQEYLDFEYPFSVIADQDEGGYVIQFPDLPGCLTQVDDIAEIPEMAEDARRLWIETAYDHGFDIPLPSYPEEYSGKFNVRLPRSLHRKLAESAKREGVSLNQHVVSLLSEEVTLAQVSGRLDDVESKLESIDIQLHSLVSSAPEEIEALQR